MFTTAKDRRFNDVFRSIIMVVLTTFLTTSIIPPQRAYASSLNLPIPGTMVKVTDQFMPAMIKGIKIDPNDPLAFNFLVDPGQLPLTQDEKTVQYRNLVKYFLAALTTPESDMWVNLSPYEHNRIISKNFSGTEMGRDLLAQDYILKQLTASLVYPEDSLGKKFWNTIYERVRQETGSTANIPVNTFNKVWIVPQSATIFEKGNVAMVTDSRLKILMEEDYLALDKHANASKMGLEGVADPASKMHSAASETVRNIVIPAIEKEVNEGKNFTQLRQMYNSMILASWFKQRIKMHLLNKMYTNKNKAQGVELQDPKDIETVFQSYVQAYKKGVYNYIKEENDPVSGQSIPKKYFSGGGNFAALGNKIGTSEAMISITPVVPDSVSSANVEVVDVKLDPQGNIAVSLKGSPELVAAAGAILSVFNKDQKLGDALTAFVSSTAGRPLTPQQLKATVSNIKGAFEAMSGETLKKNNGAKLTPEQANHKLLGDIVLSIVTNPKLNADPLKRSEVVAKIQDALRNVAVLAAQAEAEAALNAKETWKKSVIEALGVNKISETAAFNAAGGEVISRKSLTDELDDVLEQIYKGELKAPEDQKRAIAGARFKARLLIPNDANQQTDWEAVAAPMVADNGIIGGSIKGLSENIARTAQAVKDAKEADLTAQSNDIFDGINLNARNLELVAAVEAKQAAAAAKAAWKQSIAIALGVSSNVIAADKTFTTTDGKVITLKSLQDRLDATLEGYLNNTMSLEDVKREIAGTQSEQRYLSGYQGGTVEGDWLNVAGPMVERGLIGVNGRQLREQLNQTAAAIKDARENYVLAGGNVANVPGAEEAPVVTVVTDTTTGEKIAEVKNELTEKEAARAKYGAHNEVITEVEALKQVIDMLKQQNLEATDKKVKDTLDQEIAKFEALLKEAEAQAKAEAAAEQQKADEVAKLAEQKKLDDAAAEQKKQEDAAAEQKKKEEAAKKNVSSLTAEQEAALAAKEAEMNQFVQKANNQRSELGGLVEEAAKLDAKIKAADDTDPAWDKVPQGGGKSLKQQFEEDKARLEELNTNLIPAARKNLIDALGEVVLAADEVVKLAGPLAQAEPQDTALQARLQAAVDIRQKAAEEIDALNAQQAAAAANKVANAVAPAPVPGAVIQSNTTTTTKTRWGRLGLIVAAVLAAVGITYFAFNSAKPEITPVDNNNTPADVKGLVGSNANGFQSPTLAGTNAGALKTPFNVPIPGTIGSNVPKTQVAPLQGGAGTVGTNLPGKKLFQLPMGPVMAPNTLPIPGTLTGPAAKGPVADNSATERYNKRLKAEAAVAKALAAARAAEAAKTVPEAEAQVKIGEKAVEEVKGLVGDKDDLTITAQNYTEAGRAALRRLQAAAPKTGPVTTAPKTGPVTTAPVTGPVTTAPVTGPVTTAPVTGPVTTAPVTGPVTTAPVTAPVITAPVDDKDAVIAPYVRARDNAKTDAEKKKWQDVIDGLKSGKYQASGQPSAQTGKRTGQATTQAGEKSSQRSILSRTPGFIKGPVRAIRGFFGGTVQERDQDHSSVNLNNAPGSPKQPGARPSPRPSNQLGAPAVVDNNGTPLGGIDFDDKYLQMNLKGDPIHMQIPENFKWLLNAPITGFTPRILDIRSGVGYQLSFFKGLLTPEQQRTAKAQSNAKLLRLAFADHKFLMKGQFVAQV